MKHTPYDADQRNGTHECDPKAIEHRLEVATDAMRDWSVRNSELRKQNREKNELLVQLREELAQADSARLYAQSEILCRDKQVEALRRYKDETTEALRQFTLWAPRGWSLELDQALTLARQVVAAPKAFKDADSAEAKLGGIDTSVTAIKNTTDTLGQPDMQPTPPKDNSDINPEDYRKTR